MRFQTRENFLILLFFCYELEAKVNMHMMQVKISCPRSTNEIIYATPTKSNKN